LVYEVAWSRALVLIFGTSVYAFATMLTTYLVGLALGSLLMGRVVDRIGDVLKAFAVTQVVIGLSVYASTYAIGELPRLLVTHFRADTPWHSMVTLEFALCFVIMFIPAFGSGTLFPLTARILLGQKRFRIGPTIADSYAVNTVGCIVGAFAAGFVLIPLLGIEKTLLSGGSLNLIIAAVVILFFQSRSPRSRAVMATVLVVSAITGVLVVRTWRPLVMNSGVYVYGEPLSRMEQKVDTFAEETSLVYYREGPSATVAVLENERGRFLRINGKTDGGYANLKTPDNLTQSFLGLLPLLYVPQVKQALVIGAGTGQTVDGVHADPRADVDCVEIEPAVLDAARYFERINGAVFDSPRVHSYVLDGRTWVSAMAKQYDVIVSEPSHPWQTGNANLFTEEFFEASAKRLTPGGVFCQWLPYYQMDPDHFRMLLRTFQRAYPYVNAWVVYTDVILLGSMQPLQIPQAALTERMQEPRFRDILASLGVSTESELLSFFYLDTAALAKFAGAGGPFNTDDMPVIEYSAPKYLLQRQETYVLYRMLQLSLESEVPVDGEGSRVGRERARVAERANYLRKWGMPEQAVREMLAAYDF